MQQSLSARVSWSESDVGGSGIDGRTLWRQRSSPVTPGVCSGLTFYNVGYDRTAKQDYTDSLYNGYCYRWSLSLRDRAGNVVRHDEVSRAARGLREPQRRVVRRPPAPPSASP